MEIEGADKDDENREDNTPEGARRGRGAEEGHTEVEKKARKATLRKTTTADAKAENACFEGENQPMPRKLAQIPEGEHHEAGTEYQSRAHAELHATELAARDGKVLLASGEPVFNLVSMKYVRPTKEAARIALRCGSCDEYLFMARRLDCNSWHCIFFQGHAGDCSSKRTMTVASHQPRKGSLSNDHRKQGPYKPYQLFPVVRPAVIHDATKKKKDKRQATPSALAVVLQEYQHPEVTPAVAQRQLKHARAVLSGKPEDDVKAIFHLQQVCSDVGIKLKFIRVKPAKAKSMYLAVLRMQFDQEEERKLKCKLIETKGQFDPASANLEAFDNADPNTEFVVGFQLSFKFLTHQLRGCSDASFADFCHTKAGCLGGIFKLDRSHRQVPVALTGFDGINESSETWNALTKTAKKDFGDAYDNVKATLVTDGSAAAQAATRSNLPSTQHFFCSNHRSTVVSQGRPKETAGKFMLAVSAPDKERLAAAKENMSPELRGVVEKVRDEEQFPAANPRVMVQSTTNAIEGFWSSNGACRNRNLVAMAGELVAGYVDAHNRTIVEAREHEGPLTPWANAELERLLTEARAKSGSVHVTITDQEAGLVTMRGGSLRSFSVNLSEFCCGNCWKRPCWHMVVAALRCRLPPHTVFGDADSGERWRAHYDGQPLIKQPDIAGALEAAKLSPAENLRPVTWTKPKPGRPKGERRFMSSREKAHTLNRQARNERLATRTLTSEGRLPQSSETQSSAPMYESLGSHTATQKDAILLPRATRELMRRLGAKQFVAIDNGGSGWASLAEAHSRMTCQKCDREDLRAELGASAGQHQGSVVAFETKFGDKSERQLTEDVRCTITCLRKECSRHRDMDHCYRLDVTGILLFAHATGRTVWVVNVELGVASRYNTEILSPSITSSAIADMAFDAPNPDSAVEHTDVVLIRRRDLYNVFCWPLQGDDDESCHGDVFGDEDDEDTPGNAGGTSRDDPTPISVEDETDTAEKRDVAEAKARPVVKQKKRRPIRDSSDDESTEAPKKQKPAVKGTVKVSDATRGAAARAVAQNFMALPLVPGADAPVLRLEEGQKCAVAGCFMRLPTAHKCVCCNKFIHLHCAAKAQNEDEGDGESNCWSPICRLASKRRRRRQ